MFKKVLSLILATVLTCSLLPVPVNSAAITGKDLDQQIRNVFRQAAKTTPSGSFNGYCGNLVSWQTYLLGIDTQKQGNDGKNQFDHYRNMDRTGGGYRVDAYPASGYTLREALLSVTKDGKANAYNILVGFERTNTQAGQKYGHALFVHGIVDGTVYFVECFNASIGGNYFSEGQPIHCSIDEFCTYYNRWTVFDGIIHFGLKTYASQCTRYPSYLYGITLSEAPVTDEPWDPVLHEGATAIATLSVGEPVRVTELLLTPGGKYFYGIESNGVEGYVPAEYIRSSEPITGDVSLDKLSAPTSLRKGYGHTLKGTVSTSFTELKSVYLMVYIHEKGPDSPEFSVNVDVSGKSFSLRNKTVDNAMSFRLLEEGIYHFSIRVKVQNHYLHNGELLDWGQEIELWNSDFQVVNNRDKYYSVHFDSAGGESSLLSMTLAAGQRLGMLPTAVRPGYTLEGWFTQPEGGEAVTVDTIITQETKLYAHWVRDTSTWEGWVLEGDTWNHYQNGERSVGWLYFSGILFFRLTDGTAPSGWTRIGNYWYFFNQFGAAQTGWREEDFGKCYLLETGRRASGWTDIDGKTYYFGENGAMHTGWLTDNGNRYWFREDGTLATGKQTVAETTYYFREDGTVCTGWVLDRDSILFLNPEGIAVTGWHSADGLIGYFDENGILRMTSSVYADGMWQNVSAGTLSPAASLYNLYILP